MFVSDWMTKKVYTLTPDDSMSDAAKLSREKGIKHIPVLKKAKLMGILSDRDIKEYIPSRAASVDLIELHSLLEKTRVKEAMNTRVVTVTPDMPVEDAAIIMHDESIGCLPVVEHTKLAGIISDRDMFRALVDITGARHRGHRIFVTVKDKPGAIKEVMDIVRKHGFNLQSMLTCYEGAKKGFRNIVIRLKGTGNFVKLRMELEASYTHIKIKKG
jgi:acetoin utilization protein AcuB